MFNLTTFLQQVYYTRIYNICQGVSDGNHGNQFLKSDKIKQ